MHNLSFMNLNLTLQPICKRKQVIYTLLTVLILYLH